MADCGLGLPLLKPLRVRVAPLGNGCFFRTLAVHTCANHSREKRQLALLKGMNDVNIHRFALTVSTVALLLAGAIVPALADPVNASAAATARTTTMTCPCSSSSAA